MLVLPPHVFKYIKRCASIAEGFVVRFALVLETSGSFVVAGLLMELSISCCDASLSSTSVAVVVYEVVYTWRHQTVGGVKYTKVTIFRAVLYHVLLCGVDFPLRKFSSSSFLLPKLQTTLKLVLSIFSGWMLSVSYSCLWSEPILSFDEILDPALERPEERVVMGSLLTISRLTTPEVPSGGSSEKRRSGEAIGVTSHCCMPLVTPVAGGSSFAAAPEVSAPAEVERRVLLFGSPRGKRFGDSRVIPFCQAAEMGDLPSFALLADIQALVVHSQENVGITPTSDVAGSSQLETSEGSDDSFYELLPEFC
ncbi:hypothetical protein Tco_0823510 [Tanacetum coccineum]|uniref:Uncharacterized protein n=1 Tax=Tanacetum coccineum TaxID=301880 RepID=A0ABQ5AM61_9ASTR